MEACVIQPSQSQRPHNPVAIIKNMKIQLKPLKPWLSELSSVIVIIIIWLLLTPNPNLWWFIFGVIIGTIGQVVSLWMRRKDVTRLFSAIRILLVVMAVAMKDYFPDLWGCIAGIYLPGTLVIIVYQLTHKRVLSLEDFQKMYGIESEIESK